MTDVHIQFLYNAEGNLIPYLSKDNIKLAHFKKLLQTGDILDCYFSKIDEEDGSLGQLAKVHASIKELAGFTGHTIQEMKDEVKRQTGLIIINEEKIEQLKSFANCSKDELSRAIQTCINIGNEIGYYIN